MTIFLSAIFKRTEGNFIFNSNFFTQGSVSSDKTLNASMFSDNPSIRNTLKNREGYKFLKSIRGSAPYWEVTTKDLFAMVLQLGIPTWFCSFSAADRRWPEIREAILLQQKKDIPQEKSWEDHCQTLKSNPVTATIMFQRRVHAFINKVILSKSNPIGHVIDYFYRVEFQSRGWPHIHCLFWI